MDLTIIILIWSYLFNLNTQHRCRFFTLHENNSVCVCVCVCECKWTSKANWGAFGIVFYYLQIYVVYFKPFS